MKKAQPTAIRDVLKKTIAKIGAEKKARLTEEKITEIWKKVAGESAARHSHPKMLKGGLLTVNVDSSAWIYELTLKKEKIEKKINRLIKQKKPLRIRLRAGEDKD